MGLGGGGNGEVLGLYLFPLAFEAQAGEARGGRAGGGAGTVSPVSAVGFAGSVGSLIGVSV